MPTIRIAQNHDQSAWDSFVLSQPEAGSYHLYAWGQAVAEAYHHRPYYLICEDERSQIRGVLPLILIKAPLLKGSLVSLPFCDYGGPLATDLDSAMELVQYALNLSQSLNARLELRCRMAEPQLERLGLGVVTHKVRMVLDLPAGSQDLWKGFKSKLRSQIKRPQKDGLEFRLGGVEQSDAFYTVFRINMRELGSPVHARAWIAAVLEAFGSRAHVGVVHDKECPVAAGIVLDGRDMVTIPWASALSSYSKSSPNMLLYWGFLQYASDHGFKSFDFGRSTPGEGTYRFKEQWGAVPQQLYWYGDGFSESESPLVGGWSRDLVARTWTKLPQPLVDIVGPCLRRYITL